MSGSVREVVCLHWRPFSFVLPTPLTTAAGVLAERRGWLLRLETDRGARGWGEAAPLAVGPAAEEARQACAQALGHLGSCLDRLELERLLPALPPALAFALGGALAEADGLVGPAAGGWRRSPPSAWLLPAGAEGPGAALGRLGMAPLPAVAGEPPPTVKWKIGVHPASRELDWCGDLLALLPAEARLRLDANGGLDRATASLWADLLEGDGRLEWLEQPLPPDDHEGLVALSFRLPVALDESLQQRPQLRHRWTGWQVRRPSQEGDPRPLLAALQAGQPRWMVSTSLETGIGRRWLAHLAALQAMGPTPTAPGLAPGWQAPGALGADLPEVVWRAAEAG